MSVVFECWHIFGCDKPVAVHTFSTSENAVNVLNEVRVDNHEAD